MGELPIKKSWVRLPGRSDVGFSLQELLNGSPEYGIYGGVFCPCLRERVKPSV